jgi:hypothetical protein
VGADEPGPFAEDEQRPPVPASGALTGIVPGLGA